MKKTKNWVLVADGQHAQVFQSEGWGHGLRPVEGAHFEGKVPAARAIGTDKPGRLYSGAHGRPSAVGETGSLHRAAKERFVKSVAAVVDRASHEGAFERLVVIAPPEALGEIRATLSDQTKKKIVAELHKDLTHLPLPDLEKQLTEIIPV